MKEKLDVKMTGITCKEVKDGEDILERYIVKLEIVTDDFDKAVSIAKDLEQNLANNLKKQTVLK